MYAMLFVTAIFPLILLICLFLFFTLRWQRNKERKIREKGGIPNFLNNTIYLKPYFWWFYSFIVIVCVVLYIIQNHTHPELLAICLSILILRYGYANSLGLLDFYLREYGNEYDWINVDKRGSGFRFLTAIWQKHTYVLFFDALMKAKNQTDSIQDAFIALMQYSDGCDDPLTKKLVKNFFINEPMYKHISQERNEKFTSIDILKDMFISSSLKSERDFDSFSERMMYYWIMKLRHSDLRWLRVIIHPGFAVFITVLVGSCFYIFSLPSSFSSLSRVCTDLFFGLALTIGLVTVLFATILYSQKGTAICLEKISDLKNDVLLKKIKNNAIFNSLAVIAVYGLSLFILFYKQHFTELSSSLLIISSIAMSVTAFCVFLFSDYAVYKIITNSKTRFKEKIEEILSKYKMDDVNFYVLTEHIFKIDSYNEWPVDIKVFFFFLIPQLLALLQILLK